MFVAGHNEKIAWGMTNLMVDDIDLFAEKINPENQDQYLFDGAWKDMDIRNEIIKIKGGETGYSCSEIHASRTDNIWIQEYRRCFAQHALGGVRQ